MIRSRDAIWAACDAKADERATHGFHNADSLWQISCLQRPKEILRKAQAIALIVVVALDQGYLRRRCASISLIKVYVESERIVQGISLAPCFQDTFRSTTMQNQGLKISVPSRFKYSVCVHRVPMASAIALTGLSLLGVRPTQLCW